MVWVLPLTKPALATAGLFMFIGSWDAFFWPLVATRSEDLAVVYTQASTTLYVDGAPMAHAAATAPEDFDRLATFGKLDLESPRDDLTRRLTGRLDEIAIYDHALTEQQIARRYRSAAERSIPETPPPTAE